MIRILFFGDIFGRPGRRGLAKFLNDKKDQINPDLIIANVDNVASGKGPNISTYDEIRNIGVDILTCGDHIWDQKECLTMIDQNDSRLVRPINYPKVCPGKGSYTVNIKGIDIEVVSVLGRVWTTEGLDSPFYAMDDLLSRTKSKVIFVDFHAEATSEKNAFGFYLAGKVSAIVGTHTHVQTADERILDEHTAFISDAGFCGPYESVIGVKKEQSIKRFTSGIPVSFDVADGPVVISGVIVDIDEQSGKAIKIERIREVYSD